MTASPAETEIPEVRIFQGHVGADIVLSAMSPTAARELSGIIARSDLILDEVWQKAVTDLILAADAAENLTQDPTVVPIRGNR